MKWIRGFSAGVTFALGLSFLSGCSNDNGGDINDQGSYSPIITGISGTNEPAIRGVSNQFTLLVTNVNNLAITYHWASPYGALTDTTQATVSWVVPDSVATYPLTASIEATDGTAHFFKTTTFQVFVDNEYKRWTHSDDVQYDPAPKPGGGVLFAQYRNIVTGESDVYQLAMAGLSPEPLTTGFFTANSPTMSADGQVLAVRARSTSIDSLLIWGIPGAGGGPSSGRPLALFSNNQRLIANPRFAAAGRWLLYSADSERVGEPRPLYRDVTTIDPNQPLPAPISVVSIGAFFGAKSLWLANWSPDKDGNGTPDSLVAEGYENFGNASQTAVGLYKLSTAPDQTDAVQWLPDSSATEPDWSSDGQHIVFTRRNAVSGDRDIWIINAGSSNPADALRVTTGPADDSHPRFSPDGSTIFFVSNRTDRYGLNGIYNTERRGTNIWSVTRFDQP